MRVREFAAITTFSHHKGQERSRLKFQISNLDSYAMSLGQGLAKEPRERPFSAQQVRRALAPFLPQDDGAGRDSTQTFEKLNQQQRAAKPKASGTLRPPRAVRTAKTQSRSCPSGRLPCRPFP